MRIEVLTRPFQSRSESCPTAHGTPDETSPTTSVRRSCPSLRPARKVTRPYTVSCTALCTTRTKLSDGVKTVSYFSYLRAVFKTIVNMIRQCAILFGCLALGELIVYLTGIKLPSSIIGMLLLTLFLKLGWIKLQWVQGLSDFLVANLGFFFVPPGVALMLYFDVIAAEFWPIVIATIVSTVLVLSVTGWVHQIVRKIQQATSSRQKHG